MTLNYLLETADNISYGTFNNMSPLLEKISKEVMNLPQEEKISLVNLLLEDLDGIEDSEEEIQQAWDEEIQRRVDLVKSDKAQLFDGEEVLKEARDIIKK